MEAHVVRNAVMHRLHYPLDVILLCMQWYLGYLLRSTRSPWSAVPDPDTKD
jgi:hypothetical protein